MPTGIDVLGPDQPLAPGVQALSTRRAGGVSTGPWASFNLGDHVGDDPAAVGENRARLREALGLPGEPQWLRQVHGTRVVDAQSDGVCREGDAAWTNVPGVVCAVLTADCLPVVLAASDGSEIAVAHCGWRGLSAGILARTIGRFAASPATLRAWLGPAIGQAAFEVGAEVRKAFLATAEDSSARERIAAAFGDSGEVRGKYHADLYALAREALLALGVREISGGGRCTVAEPEAFFSYRRDGVTGRMATLAWITPQGSGTGRT
ncbi:MAG: peptidoglycan editing factor PgeF [Gammaproteobacteria bacterium]